MFEQFHRYISCLLNLIRNFGLGLDCLKSVVFIISYKSIVCDIKIKEKKQQHKKLNQKPKTP